MNIFKRKTESKDIRIDVRQLDLTDDEIIFLIEKSFGESHLLDYAIDSDEEDRIFRALHAIEGLQEYWRKTMGRDKDRYFNAQPGLQSMYIKGAYMRTAWERKKISASVSQKEKKAKTKSMRSLRHL